MSVDSQKTSFEPPEVVLRRTARLYCTISKWMISCTDFHNEPSQEGTGFGKSVSIRTRSGHADKKLAHTLSTRTPLFINAVQSKWTKTAVSLLRRQTLKSRAHLLAGGGCALMHCGPEGWQFVNTPTLGGSSGVCLAPKLRGGCTDNVRD